jgi:hypothetical protein
MTEGIRVPPILTQDDHHASVRSERLPAALSGGVHRARKALAEEYIADNQAIAKSGPIDVEALVSGTLPADTPGLGPNLFVAEDMVRYNNPKYDPDNHSCTTPATLSCSPTSLGGSRASTATSGWRVVLWSSCLRSAPAGAAGSPQPPGLYNLHHGSRN